MAVPTIGTIAPLYKFGAGQLWCVPNGGNLATNPTPQRLATLQEVTLEFGADIKSLWGENQFPEVSAVGKRKVSGKFKIGRWNSTILNQILVAGTQSTGMDLVSVNEQSAVPATPYQITVVNSSNFVEDLGVHYQNGAPLTNVGSGSLTAIGQYKVAAGVYTFDAAETTNIVQIDYTYAASGTGITISAPNQVMGWGPVFSAVFRAPFRGEEMNIVLQACIAGKLSMGSKVDDFTLQEIDFEAFADQNQQVFYIYATQ